MGTPGVPWNVTKDQIVASIKKQFGRLTYVARELDCDYSTVKKRVDKDPELQQILADARNGFGENLLDLAESALLKGLHSEESNAYLKSAFFVLNNKGRERGYTPPSAAIVPNDSSESIRIVISDMKGSNARNSTKPESSDEPQRGDSEA